MIRRAQTSYNPDKISRVDFGKHPQSISVRRITVGTLVGLVVAVALTVAFV